MEGQKKLWNRNFVKAMFGNFLLFFAFYLTMPLLPLYLKDTFQADKDTIGIVLSGFTIAALLVRPFSGFIVDNFPRKRVLLFCYFGFVLFFAGYLVAGTLLIFAIIRTAHGLTLGSSTVANSTIAIDVLYPERRAEGIGYYGLSNNMAMALGPSVALWVYHIYPDFKFLFLLSLVSAGIGFIIISTIESRQQEIAKRKGPLSLDRFFLVKGWRAGISIACFGFAYGVLSTYLAIYGKELLGITSGTGTYFMILALGLMTSRVLGSRTLRRGKITYNAAIGVVISLVGYTLFAGVHEMWAYYLSALVIGLGNGHLFPAYQSMFINLAPHTQRGTANSTLLTSWDLGLGIGIMLGGIIAETINYHATFWSAVLAEIIGVSTYFMVVRKYYLANRVR